MNPCYQFLIGLISSISIAYFAYKLNSLSLNGFFASVLVGTIIFGLGGIAWAILLLAFFVSSSILSKMFRKRKSGVDEKFSKGSQRDAGQVFANGAVAACLALTWFVTRLVGPGSNGNTWIWVAFAGSLAAATADTWGTELGVLSRRRPVLITKFKPVDPGTSGGISLMGALAALAGAALIAWLAVIMSKAGWVSRRDPDVDHWIQFALITFAGFAGSLVDSLLGATKQAIYFCHSCQKETEKHPLHTCGKHTDLKRGWAWLNNDWVNAACVLAGALIAGLLSTFVI